jgi:spermidine synthase
LAAETDVLTRPEKPRPSGAPSGERPSPARVFLGSFLVLFYEVALIRWLPSQVRLLAYFSNLILLASFLGIGLGCLLARSRRNLLPLFPSLLLGILIAVAALRLEVAVPTATEIYFSSGTTENRLVVQTWILLPVLFVGIAAFFAALAQGMGREMNRLPALRAYAWNVAGSLVGVGAFGLFSSYEQPAGFWFFGAALLGFPFLGRARLPVTLANGALLLASVPLVHGLAPDSLWSPYSRITVRKEADETVLEVNAIFHQSMAPLERKEYFYEWPYAAFGDSFEDVLILGAGSGTDVAAALRHGAKRVDAVEIDPVILRLGAELHPERPYDDPRVTRVCDDARHFLRTTGRRYDLVVFGLVDSLTVQSSFSSVRLESFLFTEESFRAVRDVLKPNGLLCLYNYFREKWLVDRLASLASSAFGEEPRVQVHERRSWLAVMLAGPRLRGRTDFPPIPDRVLAYGHARETSPGRLLQRDASVPPTSDDWPFLYMRSRHLPAHYLVVLAFVLAISGASILGALRRAPGRWSWECFFLGAGFLLLETKSIVQFGLLWGSTWAVASAVIASILVLALAATLVVSRIEIRRPWVVTAALLALLGLNALFPIGSVRIENRWLESAFFAGLGLSPIFCAGLLFGTAIKRSGGLAREYGANLLGAVAGGVLEYLSLVTGYRFLLLLVGLLYVGARLSSRSAAAPAT